MQINQLQLTEGCKICNNQDIYLCIYHIKMNINMNHIQLHMINTQIKTPIYSTTQITNFLTKEVLNSLLKLIILSLNYLFFH
jgi:hypothetical protein